MTTPLPAAPSLEQLRKQAKELVRERRAGGEPVRLSEAQRELARAYGFPSWPRLKAYVERVSAHGPGLTAFVDELGYTRSAPRAFAAWSPAASRAGSRSCGRTTPRWQERAMPRSAR